MMAIRSIEELLRIIWIQLPNTRCIQLANESQSLVQLITLALMNRAFIPPDLSWQPKQIVLVLNSTKEFGDWADFATHSTTHKLHALPHMSHWGRERYSNQRLIQRQRISALSAISRHDSSLLVLTTPMGLAQLTMCCSDFVDEHLKINVGAEVDLEQLVLSLEDLGYVIAQAVEEQGAFAVRGGVIDIWSVNHQSPHRFEFFGDIVESIRIFEGDSQRSRGSIESVTIAPALEAIVSREKSSSNVQNLFNVLIDQQIEASDRDGMIKALQQGVKFAGFDMFTPLFRPRSEPSASYFFKDAVLLFPKSISSTVNTYQDFYSKSVECLKSDRANNRASLEFDKHFLLPNDFENVIKKFQIIEFSSPYVSHDRKIYTLESNVSLENLPSNAGPASESFERWVKVFSKIIVDDQGSVAILAHEKNALDRIKEILVNRGFEVQFDPNLHEKISQISPLDNGIVIGPGDLISPLWVEERRYLIVPESSLFGVRHRVSKNRPAKMRNYLSSLSDLKVGDLVVHLLHGIGRYDGMTTLIVDRVASEFLVISYFGADKIYLPVDRLRQLQRYTGVSDSENIPTLDRLGGLAWEKRKSRVKEAVKEMAEQLLKIQAVRATTKGHQYSNPDNTYFQFEAEFPFEETDDQLRAIGEVDTDLRSGKPMDRLICGDVGFGKTEVALRATMRTLLEGLQALVVVPTTVLCHQHYRTFRQRLEHHGVRVAFLNRLVGNRKQLETIEGLSNGSIDVLIGTHRLFSGDIKPKRLGLLVIDEEQRFGVSHKEKLKLLRANAHVLTLSATPIPRTLHMAMLGLKDISIMATPPQDRLAVRTYVTEFADDVVREAIEQEIRRGGQIFFVHNRIEDIENVQRFLKKLVPMASVRIAHGQMPEHQLDRVIIDFIEKKFDVLLCTTIIEAGVDMPNVNTLIVDRADRFGLAQLYQLRGRVGRSALQGHAYFLTPAQQTISDEVRERLSVLVAYQELGSGFEIARHDLELRGAGNLLGGEQSGNVAAVGLEFYTDALEKAIDQVRGVETEDLIDPEIKIKVSAFIPKTYISSEKIRLTFYKKLFAVRELKEIEDLSVEFQDRFGLFPLEVKILFRIAKLKIFLSRISCVKLTETSEFCELKFSSLSEGQIGQLISAAAERPNKYRLSSDYRLLIGITNPLHPTLDQQLDFLDRLIKSLDFFIKG